MSTDFDPTPHVDQLARTHRAVEALLRGIDMESATWRPPDGAWSLLEIARHLLDEERRDFRPRLEHTLRDPLEAWEPVDPERWAREERYHDRPLDDVLDEFASERDASLAWLGEFASPDWGRSHRFQGWDFAASEILGAWAAHDVLHIRQIAKRLYQLGECKVGGAARYAGEI